MTIVNREPDYTVYKHKGANIVRFHNRLPGMMPPIVVEDPTATFNQRFHTLKQARVWIREGYPPPSTWHQIKW